jgi:hypothetical protein
MIRQVVGMIENFTSASRQLGVHLGIDLGMLVFPSSRGRLFFPMA